jgi:hypothetical protein
LSYIRILARLSMTDSCIGLSRVSHSSFVCGDLLLRLSVAPALDARAPEYVLYVLDPEPEIFALAACHAYSRFGYVETDDDPDASVLRRCAIVGVGHNPALFGAGQRSFDVDALRTMRRMHFRDDEGGFLRALCEQVVPHCETLLGIAALPPERRALLGCSLSSLLALRAVLRPIHKAAPAAPPTADPPAADPPAVTPPAVAPPAAEPPVVAPPATDDADAADGRVFGCLICGSPSLVFEPSGPKLINEARRACRRPNAHTARLLMVVGELEAVQPRTTDRTLALQMCTTPALRPSHHRRRAPHSPELRVFQAHFGLARAPAGAHGSGRRLQVATASRKRPSTWRVCSDAAATPSRCSACPRSRTTRSSRAWSAAPLAGSSAAGVASTTRTPRRRRCLCQRLVRQPAPTLLSLTTAPTIRLPSCRVACVLNVRLDRS